jgi:hypothetical protein
MALTLALGISVSAISIGFVKFPFFYWDTPFVSQDNENSISRQDSEDARRALEAVVASFGRITSVQMNAKARVTIFRDADPITGVAEIHYKAAGEKFRDDVVVPAELEKLGLMRSLSIGWDGEKHYLWDPSGDVLSISKEPQMNDPTAIPNPVFLPLEFLNVRGTGCPGCRIRLSDLADHALLLTRIEQGALVQAEKQDGMGHYLYRTNGGDINGKPIHYLTRVITGERGTKVNSISILDADDNALGELILGDFRWDELINANIPNEITMLARDAIGKPQLLSVFRIDSCIFNEAIDSGSFSVGTKEAGNVWDSDTKTFLREKK